MDEKIKEMRMLCRTLEELTIVNDQVFSEDDLVEIYEEAIKLVEVVFYLHTIASQQ